MKPKNMRIVADGIEAACKPDAKPKVGFNMATYCQTVSRLPDRTGNLCGTTACIAGFTVMVFDGLRKLKSMGQDEISDRAQQILGLDRGQAEELFIPGSAEFRHAATAMDAVRTLRLASITGKIEWVTAQNIYGAPHVV